ncbi:sulfatase-like hydrolase/transferase, partial [Enterobacter hormaechei subsp. steigerwaltii]|nr:sulfatase-like hydrolase/transferase [Enterobacter hormaechei subsp. steigerwaltii]
MDKIASDKDLREPDAGLLLNIFDLYYDLASAPAQYAAKRAHILEAAKKVSTWHIRHVAPKYKNYVVVIGESARSDYMNVYGFPLPDTPFLSQTKGLLINGYQSTAHATNLSLPQTLGL